MLRQLAWQIDEESSSIDSQSGVVFRFSQGGDRPEAGKLSIVAQPVSEGRTQVQMKLELSPLDRLFKQDH